MELDASGSNIRLVSQRESFEICNVACCDGAMLVNAVQVAMVVANKDTIRIVVIVVLYKAMRKSPTEVRVCCWGKMRQK